MKLKERMINIPSTGSVNNVAVTTRNDSDYIPQELSKRVIVAVYVKNLTSSANTVSIENYDSVQGQVDGDVELQVAADEEETLDIGNILEVQSKDSDDNEHQLTYSTGGDASLVIRYFDVM